MPGGGSDCRRWLGRCACDRPLNPRPLASTRASIRSRPPPLSIANTRITGFVGITQKGPMNEPTRARRTGTSSSSSSATTTDTYTSRLGLRRSSRTAGPTAGWCASPTARRAGEARRLEHAACAEHVQADDWNKPSLKIRALNEGRWGNTIWFRCVHAPGAQRAAHPRPRHRLGRGARQRRRAASRSARWSGSSTARTPTSS